MVPEIRQKLLDRFKDSLVVNSCGRSDFAMIRLPGFVIFDHVQVWIEQEPDGRWKVHDGSHVVNALFVRRRYLTDSLRDDLERIAELLYVDFDRNSDSFSVTCDAVEVPDSIWRIRQAVEFALILCIYFRPKDFGDA